MRIILLMIIIWTLLGNLSVESSDVHVMDQQSWYDDEQKPKESKIGQDRLIKDNDDPTYQKLLSVERQYLMSHQMIKLYQQRIGVLQELRKELKKKIAGQNMKLERKDQTEEPDSAKISEENIVKRNENDYQTRQISLKDKTRINRQKIESAAYVTLNKYEVKTSQIKDQDYDQQIEDLVILIPPFVINKAQSRVSLIEQKQNLNSETRYEFGQTSNKLLFYSLENILQQIKNQHEENASQANKHVLNLALEIKPNKIKSVKISYHQSRSINGSSGFNQFEVQELITSYESNQLISQHFKWHKALDFDNLIIGFVNHTIYIKEKDRKMHEIDVGSKVLNVYSLNQYKVLFISEDKIGTINVRSFLKADQIKFEHYLGNISLIKQKQFEKQKTQSSSQVQEDYSYESFEAGTFWDSPFTKNFETLRAIAVNHLQITQQFLILLSNGEILLYSNQKITTSTNLGTQLMKELRFKNQRLQNLGDILLKTQIKMNMLPPFKQLLISSNYHNKILVFNITIPYLTQMSKGSGMTLFSSSLRSKQLTCKYWRPIELSSQTLETLNYESQIYLTIKPLKPIHILQDVSKTPSDIQGKVVHIYHCSHSQRGITISQHRLLLNLFDHNGFVETTPSTSEGRSWWWNILVVVLIVLGVVFFRKCKLATSQPTHDWDDPDIQRLYKSKNQPNQNNAFSGKRNPKVMTKGPEITQKRPTTTKSKIQYDNMIISELQNYFQKQGQKLTKEEIAYMVREIQENQSKEARGKTQMKRQEKSVESNFSETNVESKSKNAKNTQEKKKPSQQEKGKQDQSTRKKKQ